MQLEQSRRSREHYRQQGGQCPLYGETVGYRLMQAPGVSVGLGIEGRHAGTVRKEFASVTATLGVGNKMVEERKDGMLKADAAMREPR